MRRSTFQEWEDYLDWKESQEWEEGPVRLPPTTIELTMFIAAGIAIIGSIAALSFISLFSG